MYIYPCTVQTMRSGTFQSLCFITSLIMIWSTCLCVQNVTEHHTPVTTDHQMEFPTPRTKKCHQMYYWCKSFYNIRSHGMFYTKHLSILLCLTELIRKIRSSYLPGTAKQIEIHKCKKNSFLCWF